MSASLDHRAQSACGVWARPVAIDPHSRGYPRAVRAHLDEELSQRESQALCLRRGVVAIGRVRGERRVAVERLRR